MKTLFSTLGLIQTLIIFLATPTVAAERVLLRDGGSSIESLSCQNYASSYSKSILLDLNATLLRLSPEGTILPSIAERWTVDPSGKVYTFYLRESGWSDGVAITASQFVNGLRNLVSPAISSVHSQYFDNIVNAPEIRSGKITDLSLLGAVALDARTLQVTLRAAQPHLHTLLTLPALCPVREAEQSDTSHIVHLPTSGAFSLKGDFSQRGKTDEIVLVPNTHFYANADLRLDKVIYRFFENNAEVIDAYRQGRIDLSNQVRVFESAALHLLIEEFGTELSVFPSFGSLAYVFSNHDPVFTDIRLREALNISLNREEIYNQLNYFANNPTHTWVPQLDRLYPVVKQDWVQWSMERRINRAKALLAEAGYDKKNPLKLPIYYNSGDAREMLVDEMARQWSEALGVVIEPKAMTMKAFIKLRRFGEMKGIYRMGWMGNYFDPSAFLYPFYDNPKRYQNPQFDQLISSTISMSNPEKRIQKLAEAEKVLLDAHAIIPIFNRGGTVLLNERVKDWAFSGTGVQQSRYLSVRSPEV